MRVSGFSWLVLCAAIAACSKAEDGSNGSVGLYSLFDPVALNPSLCGGPAIPFPNNALFSGTTDATLNIPNSGSVPFVTAANLTDGFSTTASIFTDVLGRVDFASAKDAVVIVEINPGAAPRLLAYGTDFTVQPSTAMAQVSGTGPSAGTCVANPLTPGAKFQPISDQRSRLLIEPLKPLKPSTTYIVAVTKKLLSKDGVPATPGEQFPIVNSDTPVASQTAPVIAQMSPTQKGTLEALRSGLIRPSVLGLEAAYNALTGNTIADSDLVIAWSFTTESIGISLSRLNTTTAAAAFQVVPTGINTGGLGVPGLANTADVYAGIIQVPYYLANVSGGAGAPLATFWSSTSTVNAVNPPALGGAVPCGALAQSVSTTICHPDPTVMSTETIPVLVTVPNNHVCDAAPNAAPLCSGGVVQKPAAGWPVVIFQHGITRNRTDMFAIAPTLASAGFVTVAIDIPLHGITDNANPFYKNQLFNGTAASGLQTGERTFDIDLEDNTSGAAPSPDGKIDPSGTWFINLASLITTRDNLRQAEADDLDLARSIAAGNLDLDGNPANLSTTDIDKTKIRFVGQSLGAIVGTTVMAIDSTPVIGAAALNVPGGGLGKLVDASASIGPRIAAGLAANGVIEGTDNYETFVRFAQHLSDPGDPINYAAAANTNHPLLVTEVIGDQVVPNGALSTCQNPFPYLTLSTQAATATGGTAAADTLAATVAAGALMKATCPVTTIPASAPLGVIADQDVTVISGFLSGTDPLVAQMGITKTFQMGSVPFASQTVTPPVGDAFVQFAPNTAEHGTLLTPIASSYDRNADGVPFSVSKDPLDSDNTTFGYFAPATCAEQKQTATFLATNGAALVIGGSCP